MGRRPHFTVENTEAQKALEGGSPAYLGATPPPPSKAPPSEKQRKTPPSFGPGVFTLHPRRAGPGRRGRTKSGDYKGWSSSDRSVLFQNLTNIAMPGQRPAAPHRSPMLLMLLMFSWLRSGGALSLTQKHLQTLQGPSNVHSSPDISRFRELRKRYEDLLTRLRANQTWEDPNPDLIPPPQVRIVTPKRE